MNSTNQTDSIEDLKLEYGAGLVRFDGYLMYKLRAVEARDYLKSLEVTPENLRIRKKILDPMLRKRDKFRQKQMAQQ